MKPHAAFAVAAALGFAAILQATSVHAAPTAQTIVDVAERDNAFEPATITVAAGTTVRWTNRGLAPHTTTGGAGLWDSGAQGPGASFEFTFASAGRYTYYCRFHRQGGMVGTVVVTGGAAPPALPGAPPPEARPLAPPVTTHVGTLYLVEPGDTLSRIALRFRVPILTLVRANRLPNPNLIFAGTRLVIPSPAAPPHPEVTQPQRRACFVHRVRPRDTVSALAARYGTTIRAIARVNGIHPNFIYAGQRLVICPPR